MRVAWGQLATLGGSLAIAIGLAAVSYGHIFTFARGAGAAHWEAAVVAATVDGLIVVAIGAIGHARRTGATPPPMVKAALVVGIVATTGANVHHGLPYGWRGVVLALWVPIAAELAYQLAMWVGRTTATRAADHPSTRAVHTASLNADTVEAPPTAQRQPPRPHPSTGVAPDRTGTPATEPEEPPVDLSGLNDKKRRALSLLLDEPDISGGDLGARLDVTTRSGQRYLEQLAPLVRLHGDRLRPEIHARDHSARPGDTAVTPAAAPTDTRDSALVA